jgi:hypothetical protein
LIDVAGNGHGAELARLKIEAHNLHLQRERLKADLERQCTEHGC